MCSKNKTIIRGRFMLKNSKRKKSIITLGLVGGLALLNIIPVYAGTQIYLVACNSNWSTGSGHISGTVDYE